MQVYYRGQEQDFARRITRGQDRDFERLHLSRWGTLHNWNVRVKSYCRLRDLTVTRRDAISPPWVPFVDATVVTRVLEAGGLQFRASLF